MIFFYTLNFFIHFLLQYKNEINISRNFKKGVSNLMIKKYLVECKLFNEIIDRKNKDLERQCYYECEENDIVRVDTSIEYICQPFIIEER